MAQDYHEIDGIMGTVRVMLVDLGNGFERVRFEHTVTPDLPPQDLPKGKYMPKRIAGMVFPTRIVEYVDVPKGKYVPDDVATELVKRHYDPNYHAYWQGRGWHVERDY